MLVYSVFFFFFNDTATTEIYTLSLHDALPISRSFWRRVRDRTMPNVFFHGAYDNDRVGEVLADLDVVVVPSLWYENSPLTIQEAFIAGVPVITADAGGMAELVRDDVDGLRFRRGDVEDLRAKLQRVAADPEILERLRRGIPAVPTIEKHAAQLVDRYRSLLRSPAPSLQPMSGQGCSTDRTGNG